MGALKLNYNLIESDLAKSPLFLEKGLKEKGTSGKKCLNYYPFGSPLPGRQLIAGDQYEHGYQGQFTTKDEETGLDAFELRMWDSRLARWHSTDPYGQFHSPYLGMGNNPVSGVDPDGGYGHWTSVVAFAAGGAVAGGGIGYGVGYLGAKMGGKSEGEASRAGQKGMKIGAIAGAVVGAAVGFGWTEGNMFRKGPGKGRSTFPGSRGMANNKFTLGRQFDISITMPKFNRFDIFLNVAVNSTVQIPGLKQDDKVTNIWNRSNNPNLKWNSRGSNDGGYSFNLWSLDHGFDASKWSPMGSFPELPGLFRYLELPLAPVYVFGEGYNLFRRNTRFISPVGPNSGTVQYRVRVKRKLQGFSIKFRSR